jgi:hypothetical protein
MVNHLSKATIKPTQLEQVLSIFEISVKCKKKKILKKKRKKKKIIQKPQPVSKPQKTERKSQRDNLNFFLVASYLYSI